MTHRFLILIAATVSCAPGWGADWLTDGGNPQRTAWQKDEKILAKDNVKDLKILWKLKVDNEPREMHSLFPPLIVEKVTTRAGTKQLAFVAGTSSGQPSVTVQVIVSPARTGVGLATLTTARS